MKTFFMVGVIIVSLVVLNAGFALADQNYNPNDPNQNPRCPPGSIDYGTVCCMPSSPTPCGSVCCNAGWTCGSPSENICCPPDHPTYCASNRADDNCVDLKTDSKSCGQCGHVCLSGGLCVKGVCISSTSPCDAGQVLCVPGSLSPVTNMVQSCGVNNANNCYCASNCTLTASQCEGCLNNNSCLPIGVRLNNKYCSLDKQMSPQKNETENCSNDFECISNFCSEKCISPTIIQAIINWFSRLFGWQT